MGFVSIFILGFENVEFYLLLNSGKGRSSDSTADGRAG